jgi:hypothetical protein
MKPRLSLSTDTDGQCGFHPFPERKEKYVLSPTRGRKAYFASTKHRE